MAKKILIWKINSNDLTIASVRYRCLLPLHYLSTLGYQSIIYSSNDVVNFIPNTIGIIFVKTFRNHDLETAYQAQRLGIPIFFDLCDNIFAKDYPSKAVVHPREVFKQIARISSVLVTTGEELQKKVEHEIINVKPVIVIQDGVEKKEDIAKFCQIIKHKKSLNLNIKKNKNIIDKTLIDYLLKTVWKQPIFLKILAKSKPLQILNTKIKINSSNPIKQIIWFGNHGNPPNLGMLGIMEIAEALTKLSKSFSFQLLVVSNNYEKYRQYILPLPFKTSYAQWTPTNIYDYIKQSSVTIIPSSTDNFNICKSPNRAISSLSLGIPVVATKTPALEPFKDCVLFEDWETNIKAYFTNPHLVAKHIDRAQEIINQNYSGEVVAQKWANIIENVISKSKNMLTEKVSILILLDLIQDLDVVTPLLEKSLTRDDLSIQVCVTDWLAKQSPRVEQTLKNLNINYFIVKQKLVREGSEPSLNGFQALVTASETNAGPHKSAHILTQRFNKAGLKTYTLQHGFENIGLTYFDEIHTPDSINFASQKILIWGNLDSLSPRALPEIRERCIPVGCPKEIPPKPPQINIPGNREYLIGIFENLHWHRYDDRYRNLFLEHLEKVALTFPNTTFLVKPHHAGQWLTKRYQGEIPTIENLVIADPKKIEWEAYTAPVLINYADGIITTPSTVAFDAAMANCPVSIVSYGLNLQRYNPLTFLNRLEDWFDFIQKIQQQETRSNIQNLSSQFLQKNIVLRDVTETIFNLIKENINISESRQQIKSQSNITNQNQDEIQQYVQQIKLLKAENKNLSLEIEAMKTSKFWKLREKWFTLKKFLGINTD